MKLKSFIQNHCHLEIAEVEIELIPGIPQIHFLGLPDRLIKESFYRIKSALKRSGYQFPLSSQMIVNIKPNHLRKSSRGVELAVAIGLLLLTEQISSELIDLDWIIYGELGLDGSVYEPTDLLSQAGRFRSEAILTGQSTSAETSGASSFLRLMNLKDPQVEKSELGAELFLFKRPEEGLRLKYSDIEAEFLFLFALTGLHGLLAGDAGAGKSTLAKTALSFMSTPSDTEEGRWSQQWRPCVAPHASVTPAAFLGGGAHLYEGEIERVQSGLLLMDEFLEFDPEVLESLRGPMTGEKLRLSRGSESREILPSFQVLATTNLCPCGQWTPAKRHQIGCRFSRLRCMRYLEKLSGPILDRFGLLVFLQKSTNRNCTGDEILNRIEGVRSLLKRANFFEADSKVLRYYQDQSTRRRNYLQKVSQIYATERFLISNYSKVGGANGVDASDNDHRITIEVSFQDYNKAEPWVLLPFQELERGMG